MGTPLHPPPKNLNPSIKPWQSISQPAGEAEHMGAPLHTPPKTKIHQSNLGNQSINHQERQYMWAHRFTPRLIYKIHQLNLGNQSANHQERL
jgi:hypothetical protein